MRCVDCVVSQHEVTALLQRCAASIGALTALTVASAAFATLFYSLSSVRASEGRM